MVEGGYSRDLSCSCGSMWSLRSSYVNLQLPPEGGTAMKSFSDVGVSLAGATVVLGTQIHSQYPRQELDLQGQCWLREPNDLTDS